ncbi:cadherin-like domain-containing protein [Crocosphaera watsonii]|uniref:cadherin-like domain-containing protein n=1 Tax=Crocosphaera watsonii TaxID=263511 RepID=UPI001E323F54|nr:cadherin-like domain-containing protein [Crocosphaera watsonii]
MTNEGTGDTLESRWFDRIYMSSDSVLDGSDLLLGEQNRNGVLAVGESYTATREVTLPIGVSGDFFFIVETDAGLQVFEQAFDGNNTGFDAAPTTINLTPPPDLEVEFIDAPSEATASRPFSIDYRVTNFGATPTPNSSWRDRFYLSTDEELDTATDFFLGHRNHFGALDIGQSYDATATFTLPNTFTGDFFVFMVTDSGNNVFELNKENNVGNSSEILSIVSRPADLIVSTATAPTSAKAGQSIRVDWTVLNQGTGDTVVNSWTDRIVASVDNILGNGDDFTLGSFTHNGLLDVGEDYQRSEVVSIPFSLVGDYNLFVATDVGNSVYEASNETNNNFTPLPLTILRETPDLQVTEVDIPATAQTATIIPLSWTVENLGQGETNANFWYDEVFLSTDQDLGDNNDIFLGRIRHNNVLAAGENYTETANLLVPLDAVGDYFVIVRTDKDNQVLEDPLENNNDGVSLGQIQIEANPNPDLDDITTPKPGQPPIVIPPEFSPDLVVTGVEADDMGLTGQLLEVTWTVTNNRFDTGDRSWFDSVYLSRDQIFDRNSDIFLGSRSRRGLEAGESYTTTANFDIPRGLAGPFYVFVATDSTNRINEPDAELNNSDYDPNATEISLLPPADLVAGTITVPSDGSPGQSATLTYTVENQGTETANGRWTDSIYISADEQWDINDPLFAQVAVSGPIVGGDSYSETVTAALPGLVSGDYHVIVRSDIRNNLPEIDEDNNLAASVDQFNLDVEQLLLDTPTTGTLGEDQAVYYRVDVEAGETLLVEFDSESVNGANELYVSYGEIPTRSQFDYSFNNALSPDQEIVIPSTQSGTYFVMAYGDGVNGDPSYQLEAQTLEFSLRELSRDNGSNLGQVTLTLNGAKLTLDAHAILIAEDGTEIDATQVVWKNEAEIWATFDLQGAELGQYDVKIVNDQEEFVLTDSFTVTDQPVGNLEVNLQAPSSVRPGQSGILKVNYGNTGNTDIIAPLLQITAEGSQLKFPTQTEFTTNEIQVLGINYDGLAGVIPPGSQGTLSLIFSGGNGGTINFSVNAVNESNSLDWSELKSEVKPDNLSDTAWDNIWDNFTNSVGDNVADFQAVIAENASYLSQFGDYVHDVNRLLGFEFQQVSDYQALNVQYNLGSFGLGGGFLGDIRLITDENNNVSIQGTSSVRFFEYQTDGTYETENGDNGILTKIGHEYQILEEDGTLTRFNSTGKVVWVEDSNGNRLSTEYTDGNLTRLFDTVGNSLSFTYNDQGLIIMVVDHAGRTSTYTYDESGKVVLTANIDGEETTYTYDENYLVTSITDASGTKTLFTYDDYGRLIEEKLADGSEQVTYSYDSTGGMTITDASGSSIQLFTNELGQTVRIIDPLGEVTNFEYDDAGNLLKLTAPDGTTSRYTYDQFGNVLTQIDALGNQTEFTYNSLFNQLETLTDPRGNGLTYHYDDNGNLLSIAYADDSTETFGYDENGNLTQVVNRRGQTITYTYDESFQLISETQPDNSVTNYTYDLRGNLTAITDATGPTTFTYDDSDGLTQVSYPNGRSLSYTYDGIGRRTQIQDQDGNTVNYIYYDAGRLTGLTDGENQTIVSYTYDTVGRLSQETKGNGTYTTYTYDANSRIIDLIHYGADDTVNSRFDYTYDVEGRIIQVDTLDGTWDYTYDATSQLNNAVFTSTNANITDQNLTYVYDAVGNRIRTIVNGETTNYQSNNLNQYTSSGTVVYKYDTDGNLISKTDGDQIWTYTYDADNTLVSVMEPDGSQTQYEYDALGNRIASIYNGVRTEYLVDIFGLGDVIGEYDADGNLIAHYSHGIGLESRTDGSNNIGYYDFNNLGSTVGLTGSNGSYLNQYNYLPFGENLAETEAINNPFEYVGQWGVMEEENGLSFMRARYYDPLTGRFINPDPIGIDAGDSNFYRYTFNNPILYADPSGELFFVPILVAAAWGAAVGAGTDAAIQGVSMAVGLQDEFDYGSLGWSAGLGALGGGATAWLRNTRKGSQLITRRLSPSQRGNQFSHGIPDRAKNPLYRGRPNPDHIPFVERHPWIVDKNHPLGRLNGEFIRPNRHFQVDPRYHGGGFLIGGGNHRLPQGLTKFAPWRQRLNRIPAWMVAGPSSGITAGAISRIIRPSDPNDIIGPEGFGEENWITADETLPYMIRFENVDTATAPAQEVVITHPLDPDVDPRTFRLGSFGWSGMIFEVPENRAFYSDRIDLTEEMGFVVDVFATIDVTEGEATWTLTTIDPETGEKPEDALLGFLPPNNEEGVGDGFVTYTIRSDRDAQTGDIIDAEATIVFDTEEPIDTPPIFNTIDAVEPTSTVAELPILIPEEQNGEFLVSWSGSDDEGGSAIADFDIYVSENDGPFTLWLEDTTLTEAVFVGQPGLTYGFYSVAEDNAGNLEATPSQAQAVTTLGGSPPNESPVLAQNNGLTLDEAAMTTITPGNLEVTDEDNTADELVYTIQVNPLNGSLALDGTSLVIGDTFTQEAINNNLLSYVHDGSETNNDSFSFTVNDGADGTIEETNFNIMVDPVNDAPILAVNAALTVAEGATETIATTNLQVSDVDNSSNELTFGLSELPAHGTLFLNGGEVTLESTLTQSDIDANALTYQHNGSETLADSLSFTVNDGAGGTISATPFNITITPINDAPVANDDVYPVDENSILTVDAINGVLGNDSDADPTDILSVMLENDVSNGILNLNTDGSFEYTPNPNFTGLDTFSYTVSDGNNGTDMATVNLEVDSAPNINNPIRGGDQDDNLIGTANNDIITGLLGTDNLTGNGGSDTFVYESFRDGIDRISDFGTDDVLDLRPLFENGSYASATPFEDYIQLGQVGADTEVRVNPVGDIFPGIYGNLVTLENVTANDLTPSNFLV